MAKSYFRGHPTVVIDGKWCYADTKEVIADSEDAKTHNIRPCKKCGAVFGLHDHDPCLGNLPGVENACCGHGVQEEAYIHFSNGIRLDNFTVTELNDRTIQYESALLYYDGVQVFTGTDANNRKYLGVMVEMTNDHDKYLVVETDPAMNGLKVLDDLRHIILNRPHTEWYLMWTNAVTVEPLHLKKWSGPIPEKYLPED